MITARMIITLLRHPGNCAQGCAQLSGIQTALAGKFLAARFIISEGKSFYLTNTILQNYLG